MSNRSMLEFNHDFCPRRGADALNFVEKLIRYMSSGDPRDLPEGVTWFGMRHHSEECPLQQPKLGVRQ